MRSPAISPLDFYCQGLVFSQDGSRAWVANRYLDQVLVLDIEETESKLWGDVRTVGGFDDRAFYGTQDISPALRSELEARGFSSLAIADAAERGVGGIHAILRARCGSCHNEAAGGYLCGPDPVENFLSAVENSVGGQPFASPLLRAVISKVHGRVR